MLTNLLIICKFVYPSNQNIGIISIYFFTFIKKDPVVSTAQSQPIFMFFLYHSLSRVFCVVTGGQSEKTNRDINYMSYENLSQ